MTERHVPERRRSSEQRVSHDDREHVAEQLREAAGDGRLDIGELEERLELAFAAKTYSQLEPLTADLLGSADPRTGEPLVLETRAASAKQDGYWVVPRRITATTDHGGIAIDFTEAICRHRQVALDVDVQSGSIEVLVPRGWSVSTHAVKVNLGSVENKATAPPALGSPSLHVVGHVSMGILKIRYPRSPRKRWWKRRRQRA